MNKWSEGEQNLIKYENDKLYIIEFVRNYEGEKV